MTVVKDKYLRKKNSNQANMQWLFPWFILSSLENMWLRGWWLKQWYTWLIWFNLFLEGGTKHLQQLVTALKIAAQEISLHLFPINILFYYSLVMHQKNIGIIHRRTHSPICYGLFWLEMQSPLVKGCWRLIYSLFSPLGLKVGDSCSQVAYGSLEPSMIGLFSVFQAGICTDFPLMQ